MSYILDALRKADAQRERDPVRGIHAQPLRATMGEGGRTVAYRSWAWIAGAAGLVALAGVGWYMFRDKGTPAPAQREAVVAQAVRPPVIQAPVMQPPPAAQVLPPPAPVLQPIPQQSTKPQPNPSMEPPRGIVSARAAAQGLRAAPLPAASAVTAQADGAPPALGMRSNVVPGGPPPETTPVTPPGAWPQDPAAQGPGMQPLVPPPVRQGAPAAPGTIPPAPPTAPVAGLPADAPKLTITGGVYSTNRSQRMLIVNGQVFREGADLGSGVTLEEIRPKSVYLRFRGARYSAAMP